VTRREAWAFGLALAAVAWGVVVLAAAFAVPAYNDGSTLVAENGAAVIAPVAAPAALAALAVFGLHRRCAAASRAGSRLAWLATAALAAFSLIASASIGLFTLPAAVLLAASARPTPTEICKSRRL
jgi:hypothetical protein